MNILIKNKEQYNKFINVGYYIKSIIDNVLTPGFNIFNTPKVSHAIPSIHSDYSLLTQEDIIGAGYQSNMLTIYGEYYALFGGYPALFFFFIFAYIFKRSYLLITNRDPFLYNLYRVLILYVYYQCINSFGMDWIIFDLLRISVVVVLFKNFYKMKKRREASGNRILRRGYT